MKVMSRIAARKQKGFTLIELVMVIVILGILAAFALPRFADLGGEARAATIKGAYGSMKSASSIAYSKCLADSDCDQSAASGQTVSLEGTSIALVYGYPSQASILAAAQIDGDDFDTTTAGTVAANNAPGTCAITYTEATDTASPDISLDDSGC